MATWQASKGEGREKDERTKRRGIGPALLFIVSPSTACHAGIAKEKFWVPIDLNQGSLMYLEGRRGLL